jgi:WD40 repeat protein
VADGIYHPAVFFAQSGYFVVVGISDGTINEWPAYNPYQSPTTRGNEPHTSAITALAHNHAPDRNDMVLASGSSRINIDPDENNFVLDGHLGFIAALDFATEFDLLASGGDDGLVNIWQISSRTVWRNFRGHVGRVTAVAFSPDDAWLASAGAEGLVRLWRLRLPTAEDISLAELACQQIHRNLTWEEWQLYVNRPLYRPTCPNLPVSPSVPPEALAAQTNSALSSLDISIIVLSFSGLFITWQRQRYRV